MGVVVLDAATSFFICYKRGPLTDGGKGAVLIYYERGPIRLYDNGGCRTIG